MQRLQPLLGFEFFHCSNFFVVGSQNKGDGKEKKRLYKRIKKKLQRQTNPNMLPGFVWVYAFVQLFRTKSVSRLSFLLWHKNKLSQNKIKVRLEKKKGIFIFFVCSNFSFLHMYFLATLLYKSVPFFTKFSVAKKIFPKTKTKSRLYRCLTLFCFNFVKHMLLEKKLFSCGNCMLVKICFDILKPKFCVTLFCFCSTFMPKPFSFSVLMFNVFVPFFLLKFETKRKWTLLFSFK